MKRLLFSIAVVALGACAGTPDGVPDPGERAYALEREVERLAGSRSLWPGFAPMAIPLAVYDGERTYLFHHPDPPEGFVPDERAGIDSDVYEGRHPAVSANTSADIGGTTSATMMLVGSEEDRSLTDLAAVALHEAFHVYQRVQHPSWQANEADLFLYPMEDAGLLALRREETEALRRALAASDSAASACWARQALTVRHERFAIMDPAFAAYERGTELNEGLATYVELAAAGRKTVALPAGGFDAADVRHRAYATGAALALLLDRFAPEWQESFESDDGQSPDGALRATLGAGPKDPAGAYTFSDIETAEFERIAGTDAAVLLAAQAERRKAFEARPEWRVVVKAADGDPLWPQGFDPSNVQRVTGGFLHTRFLRLGNASAQIEAMDAQGTDIDALTEGVGPHPLFNGIRQVAIAGLAEPEVRTEGPRVSVQAPGLTADFATASVKQSGRELVVQLERGE